MVHADEGHAELLECITSDVNERTGKGSFPPAVPTASGFASSGLQGGLHDDDHALEVR